MRHPDYPFWSCISLLVVLLPARWHFRARNISTFALIFWLVLYHIAWFVNSIIWADNYEDVCPIWCDISSRLTAVTHFALPLCSIAQMRRLAAVASPKRSPISPKDRRSRLLEDIVLCFVLPTLFLPLLYIVQGHRYDIIETFGCLLTDYFSWPSIVLRYLTPLALSLTALVYAGLALWWFFKSRSQFRSMLSGSGLTTGRYLRIAGLVISDSLLNIFLNLFVLLVRIVRSGSFILPYRSFAEVHRRFSVINQGTLTSGDPSQLMVVFYVSTIYSLNFFVFFGFGEEAISDYLAAWAKFKELLRRCGLARAQPPSPKPPTLGSTATTLAGTPWIDKTFDQLQTEEGGRSDEEHHGFSGATGISVVVERSVV